MKAVVQCVSSASVVVDGTAVGSLDSPGLLVYVGITHTDGPAEVDWMARKIWGLRIFRDEQSASDVGAPVLVVSQFTLYGDAAQGPAPHLAGGGPGHRSPSRCTTPSARRSPGSARTSSAASSVPHMQVESVNEGPFTVLLER